MTSAGGLTTHVLDTARGKPAPGIKVELWYLEGDGREHLKTVRTNEDGRTTEPLLEADELRAGIYELVFGVGEYFAGEPVEVLDPPFLDRVPVRFGMADAERIITCRCLFRRGPTAPTGGVDLVKERGMPEITRTSYGKTGIPVMKVVRKENAHEVWEFVVDVTAESPELERSYTRADNSPIVATDTMKNLVNYLSFSHDFTTLEDLALHIARSLRERYAHLPRWTVHIEGAAWNRLTTGGAEHPISFVRTGPEVAFTTAVVDGDESSLSSGIRDLLVLKTTDSAFSGFHRDEFTTLPETRDRMLATSITAEWKVPASGIDYRGIQVAVRETILHIFAELKSESVQHLAHETATAVLESVQEVEEISLRLPNKHYFLMDLSPFGVENKDTLYLPTTIPHGDIHLTVRR